MASEAAATFARKTSEGRTPGYTEPVRAPAVRCPASQERPLSMATDPVPATSSPLIPMLVCRNVGAQLEFCTKVFDAVEVSRRPGPDGNVVHALIKIRDAMVIIEGEWPTLTSRAPQGDGSSPVVIFLYVNDVDAVAQRAPDAGATILAPPQNQFWGDRTVRILDPSGHVWLVASRIEETSEGQRAQRWSDIVKRKEVQ